MHSSRIKNKLITGTFILTAAGLFTRLLGFFYRIRLSNLLGSKEIGIYQLMIPLYGVCTTLFASGIQTYIAKRTAEHHAAPEKSAAARNTLLFAALISFSISVLLTGIVFIFAPFISEYVLFEEKTEQALRLMAFSFPFFSITGCVNGYCIGKRNASIPAFSQIAEQTVRILFVLLLSSLFTSSDFVHSCLLAVTGLMIGEAASAVFNLIVFFSRHKLRVIYQACLHPQEKEEKKSLMKTAVPLTANRLIISLLHSTEAILIPFMLKRYGLASDEAMQIYGIICGMSLPFILFPSAITNALATLLLPTVSEAHARGDSAAVSKQSVLAVKYCLLIGVLSTALFLIFGNDLGNAVFHEPLAGKYLTVLSFLCPLLYLSTTLGSILNGLGLSYLPFRNSVIGLCIRIALLFLLIPVYGIYGYFLSLLISQLVLAALDYIAVKKAITLPPVFGKVIAVSCIFLFLSGKLVASCYHKYLPCFQNIVFPICLFGIFYVLLFLLAMVVSSVIQKADFIS